MAIVRNGSVVTDPWVGLDGRDSMSLDRDLSLIVDLEDWRTRRATLEGFYRLGLRLAPADAIEGIADDLALFDLIVLTFPKFSDGRAFSQARLLRERFGYSGEIRAAGHVLWDQFAFLVRSGVDAVEIEDGDIAKAKAAAEAWSRETARFTGNYQPALGEARSQVRRSLRTDVGKGGASPIQSGMTAACWAY